MKGYTDMYGYTAGDVKTTPEPGTLRHVPENTTWAKVNALVSTLSAINVQTRDMVQIYTTKIHARDTSFDVQAQIQDLHAAFLETVKTINAITSTVEIGK